jgi:hypothetical protein
MHMNWIQNRVLCLIWTKADKVEIFIHAKMLTCQITCQGMVSCPFKSVFQNGKACLNLTKTEIM